MNSPPDDARKEEPQPLSVDEEEREAIEDELSNGDVLCDIGTVSSRPQRMTRPRGSLTGTESNTVVTAVGR